MKVLIADSLPEVYVEKLRKNNLEVILNPKLGENDLPEAAKDVEIIVVRSTKVNEKTILEENLKKFKNDQTDDNLSKFKEELLSILNDPKTEEKTSKKKERNEDKGSESDSSKMDLIGAMLGAKVYFQYLI